MENLGTSSKSFPRIPPYRVELLMEDLVLGTGVWRLPLYPPKLPPRSLTLNGQRQDDRCNIPTCMILHHSTCANVNIGLWWSIRMLPRLCQPSNNTKSHRQGPLINLVRTPGINTSPLTTAI